MSHPYAPRLISVPAGVLLTLGCDARATLTYEPPYLPIQITVDTKGEVTWQTKDRRRLVTPLGVFQLGVSQTIVLEKSVLVLAVRDTRRPRYRRRCS